LIKSVLIQISMAARQIAASCQTGKARVPRIQVDQEWLGYIGAMAAHSTPDQARRELQRLPDSTANVQIATTAQTAQMLLSAGAVVDDDMRASVRLIGERFEFYRDSFSPRLLPAAESGLVALYELFGVPAAPRRASSSPEAPISVPDGGWRTRHEALWDALVPASGHAPNLQGEVIRITGRIAHELLGNGGGNWDSDYQAMLASIPLIVASGCALSTSDQEEVSRLVSALMSGSARIDDIDGLSKLAVKWLSQNPGPIVFDAPTYRR